MQTRYWIGEFHTIKAAWDEKKKLLAEFPTRRYKIRRGAKHGNEIFRLVEKLNSKQSEIIGRKHGKVMG